MYIWIDTYTIYKGLYIRIGELISSNLLALSSCRVPFFLRTPTSLSRFCHSTHFIMPRFPWPTAWFPSMNFALYTLLVKFVSCILFTWSYYLSYRYFLTFQFIYCLWINIRMKKAYIFMYVYKYYINAYMQVIYLITKTK